MKIYLVGGAVRDQLLGLPIIERDWVVVGASPAALKNLGYRQVGRGFPVFLHPETQEEYALARTEKKLGAGYYGFTCDTNPTVSLEDDLARRDLTINAMAMDDAGQLIDPYHGARDLRDKILRHVSAAFVEDPVRVLRVARFMARLQPFGFVLAPETRVLLQNMVRAGELQHLVAERVWQEWQKSLQERDPAAFITTLRSCGALRVILPEIDSLFGVPNPYIHHPEIDTGIHSMMVLEEAARLSEDAVVRFAALLHDLGKACTPIDMWPRQKNHENMGVPMITQLCRRLAIPKRYQKLAVLASQWHIKIHRIARLSAEEKVAVLEGTYAFQNEAIFEQILTVCEADFRGRGKHFAGETFGPYRQAQDWRVLLAACKQITAQTCIDQGYTGVDIKHALYAARVAYIKANFV